MNSQADDMPIDVDRRFVFVHIPKTGGTSICDLFNLSRRSPRLEAHQQTIDKQFVHFTWVELKAQLPDDFANRAFKFAFVRNPWDRFLSAYLYARQAYLNGVKRRGVRHCEKMAFNECNIVSLDAFVQTLYFDTEVRISRRQGFNGHLETQHSYVSDESGQLAMDFIGRFENFEKDVQVVASRIGLTASSVPHVRATVRTKDYREYYSDYARNAVESFYSEDIARFGYAF